MGRVLIVIDEPQTSQVLTSALERNQHLVINAACLEEAGRALQANQFDAILVDEKLPDGTAADVLALARVIDTSLGVLLLSGTGTCEHAMASMQQGFSDFLSTPVSTEVLRTAIQRVCERSTLVRENNRLREELGKRDGQSNPMSLGWIEALPPSFDMRSFLASVEKSLIERTLQATRGAQAEAARRLGLSRSDLSYKLLKYELRKETTATS
ncbi:MAG TPA: helix-turn-helix domain-containing protein [Terriglobales bacterium]|nr:helix-turn-helix domain-containing protein [Terriglobales bacterium]